MSENTNYRTPDLSRHTATITPDGKRPPTTTQHRRGEAEAKTPISDRINTSVQYFDMTEETNTKYKSIKDQIVTAHGKGALTPIKKPTKVDVITFKKQLTNVLLKCRGAPSLIGGHAYLILEEEEYQKRINKPKAKLPSDPEPPDYPGIPLTQGSLKVISRLEKAYELHAEYEQQTLDILTDKFPNSIIGLLDEDGDLEFGTTPKGILRNIEKKLSDEDEINDAYIQLLRDILDREYVINANGAEEWFKDAESDRLMITKLGFDPVQHSIIMASAQQAFKKSTTDTKDILELTKKWKKLKKTENLQDNTVKCYTEFKEFYNQELALLYVNKNTNKPSMKHKGYQAESIEGWRTTMEENISEVQSTAQDIDYALHTICDRLEGKSLVVPSDKSTATESSLSPDDAGVEERVITKLLAQGWGPNTYTNPDKKGNDRWRTYNRWCWSCGANFHHDSSGECRRKKDGHESHTTATYADPQGGNTSRNHLWGKWCGPDNKTYLTKNGKRYTHDKANE